jgi:hypothetical protein
MKLSNNPTAVASRRLQMIKRTRDDKHLPFLQAGDVHLGQHTTGARDAVGSSNLAGANTFPLAVALPGASGSAGANFTSGVSGSIGAIQAISAMYLGTPWENLRILEIMSNLGAFAPDPPVLKTGLCGSNTVVVWRRRYKQQEDQI